MKRRGAQTYAVCQGLHMNSVCFVSRWHVFQFQGVMEAHFCHCQKENSQNIDFVTQHTDLFSQNTKQLSQKC